MAFSDQAKLSMRSGLGDAGGKEVVDVIQAGVPYVVVVASSGTASSQITGHGFSTINAVQVTINKATAPTACIATYAVSGTTVTIYYWKFTASDDNTLVENDGAISASIAIWGTP